jgi:predicted ATPase
MRLLHELDQVEALERADVVGDRAERGAQPAGQLDRARGALVEHRKTGANFQSSFNLSCLAEAYARAGNFSRAIDYADQALDEIERTGERWWAAEAQRIKGKILLAATAADGRRAQDCFLAALKSAQGQNAKFWELRAAHGLASLWSTQGRDTDARKLLAPIYREFTDGIDLPDLDDANRLLEHVRKPVSG